MYEDFPESIICVKTIQYKYFKIPKNVKNYTIKEGKLIYGNINNYGVFNGRIIYRIK